jgi:hypothetical protein
MAHGDYTGQSKARLAQQYAEEQHLAAQSKTLVTQVVQENYNETVSLFCDKDYENLQPREPAEGEEGVTEVDVPDDLFLPVKFRASEDLEQVTVGQGREFNLKGGRTYEAPRWVVEHLDTQGLVYH